MNKSLALKKKLYLFLFLVFTFLLSLYLVHFLINGERGIISYNKIKNQRNDNLIELSKLKKKNEFFLDRISRMQLNTVDLDYLDEKIRENTGYIAENEIIILFKD